MQANLRENVKAPPRHHWPFVRWIHLWQVAQRANNGDTVPISWCSTFNSWWRLQMETFSALLAICAGNSPVTGEFPTQGPWRRALMFSLICAKINGWVNNREAGDLRRHRAHFNVMTSIYACMSWIYPLLRPNAMTEGVTNLTNHLAQIVTWPNTSPIWITWVCLRWPIKTLRRSDAICRQALSSKSKSKRKKSNKTLLQVVTIKTMKH